ncbi:MAG: hypothetical protein KC561_17735, partial [Myxococcales bacterium]|nr:hypothetical protein [Myxococcales bacterium]
MFVNTPTPKPPHLPNERLKIRRLGERRYADLTVYAFRDVAEELTYASAYHSDQVTAGILTGGYYSGPAGE